MGNPNANHRLLPKHEKLDFEEFPSETIRSSQFADNGASSSRSNLRSFFTEMGYSASLVDKVIKENGEDNVDLLLEILIECSVPQKAKSNSSDSLDSLFNDKDTSTPAEYFTFVQPKVEPDVFDEVCNDKRSYLLKMDFSADEVEFAMDKLGMDAPICEVVDFIFAAQEAERLDNEMVDNDDAEKNEDTSNETLFGTMEKTLHLLQLGFSENEVSLAIEKFGSEIPISELADLICAHQLGEEYTTVKKHTPKNFSEKKTVRDILCGSVRIKTEDLNVDGSSRSKDITEKPKGKRPKEEDEYTEEYPDAQLRNFRLEKNNKRKRPKHGCTEGSSSYSEPLWLEQKFDVRISAIDMSKAFRSDSCSNLNRMVTKPPCFFYGHVVNISLDVWRKMSQFLYATTPEYVDTELFSALGRTEGYLHNLPTENRFHVLPKPPMTIKDAIPGTEKWWPSWDARKKFRQIGFQTDGVSNLCERLGKDIKDSQGLLSDEQKRGILHHCEALNLVWVGPNKLGPTQPEYLELMLGYPVNHTQTGDCSLVERLHSLKYCFQTDTLGYHLSGLKSMFPEGMTMLSIFSGIGGAEVALNRLGIHLRSVVSVETSETNRKILRKWWQCSGQTGELEQLEDIEKLTSSKIERLVEKFGGFDFVMCQNSCRRLLKGPNVEISSAFDFSLFCEFVRVLRHVRNAMQRKKVTI
ncbi:hypothetical protein K2173_017433 [Erythroxylum novogranatense]|uniref:SAM-dependent MTase DRM-type domain-containing protein n=1 Tax=Erythroxylum novogranatense TaxID=1862640 RepID=A0AAV8TMT1_9ROSI|nr:hypothetical protein K2173_017433 [Erythroxylum novogranatense]